jgi:hypothetical protein
LQRSGPRGDQSETSAGPRSFNEKGLPPGCRPGRYPERQCGVLGRQTNRASGGKTRVFCWETWIRTAIQGTGARFTVFSVTSFYPRQHLLENFLDTQDSVPIFLIQGKPGESSRLRSRPEPAGAAKKRGRTGRRAREGMIGINRAHRIKSVRLTPKEHSP